mgnify:FL=1
MRTENAPAPGALAWHRIVGVRMPPDLIAAIDQAAEDADRTRSYIIVATLRKALKGKGKKA